MMTPLPTSEPTMMSAKMAPYTAITKSERGESGGLPSACSHVTRPASPRSKYSRLESDEKLKIKNMGELKIKIAFNV